MNRYVLAGTAAVSFFVANPSVGQPMGPPMMGREGRSQWGTMGPWMMGNMRRHHQVMMYGIPASYASLRDPLTDMPQNLRRGASVFQKNCVACHGQTGQGNGPAAQQLVPPPANLQWLARMPISRSDPYMYWTIAEGGKQLGSAMPSFKQSLSKEDIWSVIGYVRSGLAQKPR